jgi:hypothetical protein
MNPYSTEVHAMNAVRSTGWAGRVARIAATVALLAPIVNCTSRQLAGTSPAYLIMDSLLAAPGAEPDSFSGSLASDVLTNGGIFADNAQVTLRVALKDPGSVTTPNQPTTMNFITVTRYSVRFLRSDGRNTAGVDVPHPFDGGVTFTVDETGGTGVLTLVRVQAKAEAPLQALANNGGAMVISTIAEVTFYGTDQAGRAVSVTGTISVNFANWADPS